MIDVGDVVDDDQVLMIDGEKQQAAHLMPKKQLLQTLRRSPGRASTFVFALSQPVLDRILFGGLPVSGFS